jgi:hypothetical protein
MAMTEEREPGEYDEVALSHSLRALPLAKRVVFACACAERLLPAFRWFCERSGSDDFEVIREALDAAWSAAHLDELSESPEVAACREQVEALVPDAGDDGLFPASAIAQNAVAGVAYALRTWEAADSQASVWAARQLYEAGDVLVQQGAAVQTYIENIDMEAPLQLMLRGIGGALHDLAILDSSSIRQKAEVDGEAFLEFMTDLTDD